MDLKERNGRNGKKELKNYVFPFCMIIQKFCIVMRNGPEGIFAANQREISKLISHDHAKISHSHAKISHSHAKCSKKVKLALMHFLLRTIMQNCWNSCEIVVARAKFLDLMRNGHFIINFIFLDKEASERPLR